MARVLSVGQCGFDAGTIRRMLETRFGAEVETADSAAETLRRVEEAAFDLVLVNRVFDRDGDSGLELVARLRERGGPAVMLVSNYADAQREAVERGAAPGFGKNELGRPETLERLATVLGPARA
jgi:CheY-like chemotaxis protein